MDRMIYLAMTGAKQTLNQQATVSNNLANLSTNGFRAQTMAFRAVPIIGEGANTRAFVVDSTPGSDFAPGVIQQTGRELDVAVQGRGWIAVQAADGSEAYTRSGSLQLNANGILQTQAGQTVLGDAGPISIPTDSIVTIASDGTVCGTLVGVRRRRTHSWLHMKKSLSRSRLNTPGSARRGSGGHRRKPSSPTGFP